MNFLLTWSNSYGGLVLDKEDFVAIWKGRPKDKPLHPRPKIYQFESLRMYKGVLVSPILYRPIDWRGLL